MAAVAEGDVQQCGLPTNSQVLLDYFGETSESDFSGYDADDIQPILENSSDSEGSISDVSGDDIASAPDQNGGSRTVFRCSLPAGPKLPDNFDVSSAKPVDYFSLFCENSIYGTIAVETNKYAELVQAERQVQDKYWEPTTAAEMKAYVGLNIIMGVAPRHSYGHYWNTDPFLGSSGFSNTMTKNRYEKLTQYLHLNAAAARVPRSDPTYHPINRVKPLYTMTQKNFKKYFQHSTEVTIDEAMKGYKGRSELRQYMPAKPQKFGIKFWARCDGVNSYMSAFQLYTGRRDRTDIQAKYGLGYRVVHDLTRDIVGQNHHLYHDRFFSSITLAEHLYLDKIYTCATVNTNRKGLPEPLRKSKAQIKRLIPARGASTVFTKDNVDVTAWNDNNVVVVLHNNVAFDDDSLRCERQVGGEKLLVPIPKCVALYNDHMNGVDIHDQYRNKYPAGRPSKKYSRYLLWFMIDICCVNAFIVYTLVSTRQVQMSRYSHMDFTLELGKGLVGDYTSRKRGSVRETNPRGLEIFQNQILHTFCRLPGKKRRCKLCFERKVRRESVYGCPVCNVHLCRPCFLSSHGHDSEQ